MLPVPFMVVSTVVIRVKKPVLQNDFISREGVIQSCNLIYDERMNKGLQEFMIFFRQLVRKRIFEFVPPALRIITGKIKIDDLEQFPVRILFSRLKKFVHGVVGIEFFYQGKEFAVIGIEAVLEIKLGRIGNGCLPVQTAVRSGQR